MVLMAAFAIMLLVSTALVVTAASRRVSAQYAPLVGLYDLAIAGNEQALYVAQQAVRTHYAAIRATAQAQLLALLHPAPYENGPPAAAVYDLPGTFVALFQQAAMPYIQAALDTHFPRNWPFYTQLTVAGVVFPYTEYRATTRFTRVGPDFQVQTVVERVPIWPPEVLTGGPPALPVTVRAYLAWPAAPPGFAVTYYEGTLYVGRLDDYTVTMIDSMRIAD